MQKTLGLDVALDGTSPYLVNMSEDPLLAGTVLSRSWEGDRTLARLSKCHVVLNLAWLSRFFPFQTTIFVVLIVCLIFTQ